MLIAASALALAGVATAQPAVMRAAPPQFAAPAPVALRADQIALIDQTLQAADSHGFDPGEFDPPAGAGQAQLVAVLMRYARAVHAGRLSEDAFRDEWGLRPAPYDPAPDFARALAQDQLKSWLDSLPPPYTGYDALRQGLRTYRQIQAQGGWSPISPGDALKLGDTGVRVAELRARLAVEDPMVDAAGGPTFDEGLAEAVARAQKRFGLKDDAVVSGQTLAALNIPVERRIDQIVANMERWRWLPPVLPTDRIQVNVAAAILTVFHADTPILSMRAVTGRPGDETPMLQSRVESIVFNPPWNVPSSIAAKELWPKERAHPGYLAAHGFSVIPTGDGGGRLQQRPEDSALGKVKFDFPNKYGVYLHDTPSRGLFAAVGRLASHGCVRLQKPLELAKLVLQNDPIWTPEAIDQAVADGKTVRAPLPQPIAVFLFYWTAYVGPDGQVNFRQDPYGWDADLVSRLDAPAPRRTVASAASTAAATD